jgi:hypothetical protein
MYVLVYKCTNTVNNINEDKLTVNNDLSVSKTLFQHSNALARLREIFKGPKFTKHHIAETAVRLSSLIFLMNSKLSIRRAYYVTILITLGVRIITLYWLAQGRANFLYAIK